MMKKRLEILENILKQRSTGSNYEYLQAIQRETDRIRGHLEAVIQASHGEPWPEKPQSNPEDLEIIRLYQEGHPSQAGPGNRNGKLSELLNGIRREDPGARERIENKIVNIHKRLKAGK